MEETTITSKGQITLPKKVRKALGLGEGDKILILEREGEWVIKPKIQNPMKRLLEIREELRKEGKLFREEDIKRMIKESKKEWSKFE